VEKQRACVMSKANAISKRQAIATKWHQEEFFSPVRMD
jgi:hypothetical protein